jgi:hypothetical protein
MGLAQHQSHTTSSIATEAANASKNASTVAKALAMFAETIGETRHAADISLEISKSLSTGTAEVLEAINRLFEFAATHETIENLSHLKQILNAQRRPRAAS